MSSQPLRIVVADDERDMRDFLQRVLPVHGHTVVAVAQNGVELVEACTRTQPDLVITDIKMPILDGLSALQEIWRTTPVPAIVISAFPDQITQGPAVTSSRITLLVKPIRTSDLVPAIAQAMAKNASIDSATRNNSGGVNPA